MHALGREAHVWYAVPEQFSACASSYRALLSPDEQQRCERFHFAADSLCYLAAHALLRLALSRYVPLHPGSWQFQADRQGRPELSRVHADLHLRFNLSHTRGLVACVIARHACGIDVESTLRTLAGFNLISSLAPPEVAALSTSPKSNSTEAMLAYWTLKESYAKARGLGLALPFEKLWFSDPFSENGIRASFADDINDREALWQFSLLRPTPSHLCAVAIRSGEETPVAIVARPLDLDPAVRSSVSLGDNAPAASIPMLCPIPPRETLDGIRRPALR
jgi:4'-phosphopantetheinyl transferase